MQGLVNSDEYMFEVYTVIAIAVILDRRPICISDLLREAYSIYVAR